MLFNPSFQWNVPPILSCEATFFAKISWMSSKSESVKQFVENWFLRQHWIEKSHSKAKSTKKRAAQNYSPKLRFSIFILPATHPIPPVHPSTHPPIHPLNSISCNDKVRNRKPFDTRLTAPSSFEIQIKATVENCVPDFGGKRELNCRRKKKNKKKKMKNKKKKMKKKMKNKKKKKNNGKNGRKGRKGRGAYNPK